MTDSTCCKVGERLGAAVGFEVGERLGVAVGFKVGGRLRAAVGALLGYEQMTLLTENDPVKVLLSSHVPSPHVLIKQIAVKPLDRGVLKAWVTCIGVLKYWL